MRNAIVQLCLVVIGISSIHAVKLLQTSSFHFRMYPIKGAARVWAVQGKDSVEMMNINGEYYLRAINPGSWQVSVEARTPFHGTHFKVDDIRPGTDRDLGEVRLAN